MSDRWQEITETTNSGRTLFICKSCGRKTDAPTTTCPKPASVDWGGRKFSVPCEYWPMDPDTYVAAAAANGECVISGIVVLPDKRVISISSPIPEELARQINLVNAEYQLSKDVVEDRERKAKRHEAEIVSHMQELEAEVQRLRHQLDQYNSPPVPRTYAEALAPIQQQNEALRALQGGQLGGVLGKQIGQPSDDAAKYSRLIRDIHRNKK